MLDPNAAARRRGRELAGTLERVTAEVNSGCVCACHTGLGSSSSCEHCHGR